MNDNERFTVHQNSSSRWIITDTRDGRVVGREYAQNRATYKAARLNREHRANENVALRWWDKGGDA